MQKGFESRLHARKMIGKRAMFILYRLKGTAAELSVSYPEGVKNCVVLKVGGGMAIVLQASYYIRGASSTHIILIDTVLVYLSKVGPCQLAFVKWVSLMVANKDCCPTCGGPAGPATPQQEIESRSCVSNGPVKSLTECFEALEVASTSSVSTDAAAAEGITTPVKAFPPQDSVSSDDEAKEQVVDTPSEPGNYEPILQDNDERFCLLPVK